MKYLNLLFLFVLFMSGCSEDEMTTSLVITVVDENNIPMSDVNVDLYPSLNDWLNETSAIYYTEVTDQDGRITYIEIDTGTYYINAYKDSLTNWEEGVVKDGETFVSTGCSSSPDTSAARTFAADRARHNLRRHLFGASSKTTLGYTPVKGYHQNSDGAWCARVRYKYWNLE